MSYVARIVDDELSRRMTGAGAVLIEGPKACGKTRTAEQLAASAIQLDIDPSVEAAMAVDTSLLLEGQIPRLLDEWQLYPALWDHVRRQVDERGEPGQFILTGSSMPDEKVRSHSGAGRISRMRMRPMSLWESGLSTGDVSLSDVLMGKLVRAAEPPLGVPGLAEALVRGGWPAMIGADAVTAGVFVADYLDLLAEVDISRLPGQRRDALRVRRLLASLGRNSATEVSVSTLTSDVAGSDSTMSRDTTIEYLAALERLVITEDQPAWSISLRSSARLRKAPKRHFVDPSLAVAAIRATPQTLLADLNTMGTLFESLVVRDLCTYVQSIGWEIFHFRDSNGREADVVIQLPDGGWAACEVKLGASSVDDAASSLLRTVQDSDVAKVGEPRALISDHRQWVGLSAPRRGFSSTHRRAQTMNSPTR